MAGRCLAALPSARAQKDAARKGAPSQAVLPVAQRAAALSGFFERVFDYPYPFGKYDQLYVPEYNMGAMENAGCVTFRDEYLFRSRVTQEAYAKRNNTILHELAHAYHDQVLSFDEPRIISAYEDAMKAGIYEQSLLYTGQTVKHYATTNHKEYFAEATEAYLYHNDFYPFVRAELRQHDRAAYAEMERVWGKVN